MKLVIIILMSSIIFGCSSGNGLDEIEAIGQAKYYKISLGVRVYEFTPQTRTDVDCIVVRGGSGIAMQCIPKETIENKYCY